MIIRKKEEGISLYPIVMKRLCYSVDSKDGKFKAGEPMGTKNDKGEYTSYRVQFTRRNDIDLDKDGNIVKLDPESVTAENAKYYAHPQCKNTIVYSKGLPSKAEGSTDENPIYNRDLAMNIPVKAYEKMVENMTQYAGKDGQPIYTGKCELYVQKEKALQKTDNGYEPVFRDTGDGGKEQVIQTYLVPKPFSFSDEFNANYNKQVQEVKDGVREQTNFKSKTTIMCERISKGGFIKFSSSDRATGLVAPDWERSAAVTEKANQLSKGIDEGPALEAQAEEQLGD
jgi:hypothetical protein